MSESLLKSDEVENFSVALSEAARASEGGIGRFIEPAEGTLRRALSNRNHIIFGRRGSGKTSLLQKARSELVIGRRPNAFIDLEKFKAHSYPDVLISVLIETFSSIEGWLDEGAVAPANKRSFWHRLRPTRKPLQKSRSAELSGELKSHIEELRVLLFAQDGADVQLLRRGETVDEATGGAQVGVTRGPVVASVSGELTQSVSSMDETKESIRRSKIDFLHRRILDYQRTLHAIVALAGENGFVMLDDLYYIRRSDQPEVLDYFHRMFKGSGLWLKIGTIRHRSEWYRHGDPTIGLKLGDDVDDIDLDLTLEKYQTAKSFLQRIASELGAESDVTFTKLVKDGARDRLVLASGGVARDYLSILRRSIAIAQEQGETNVNVAAVNQAASEHVATKQDEFRRDVIDGVDELQVEFENVKQFCFGAKANCFTVEKDLGDDRHRLVKELVDLRLVHAINARVTVRHRPGRLYEAYMLDLSQYVGERKRRNFEILEFWRPDEGEKLRLTGLIYAEAPRVS